MEDYEITEWFVNLPEYKSYVDAIGAFNPELDYAGPRLIKYFEAVRHFGKPHFNFSVKQ